MINRYSNYIKKIYKWYEKNIAKIIFVAIIYAVCSMFFSLPYLNIFIGLFGFLPFLISWIVILLLFHPSRNFILILSLLAFAPTIVFYSFKIIFVAEFLSNICYFALATYIIYSLSDIRGENKI